MLSLSITPKAESDLTDVWLYTSDMWSADQADHYLDQFAVGMNQLITYHLSLITYPLLGVDYTYVLSWYRRLQVEHHSVYYRVLASEVLVVRVLHAEMDAPKRVLDY